MLKVPLLWLTIIMHWWPKCKDLASCYGFPLLSCKEIYFLIRSLPGIKILTGNSVWDKEEHGQLAGFILVFNARKVWKACLLSLKHQEGLPISNTKIIKFPQILRSTYLESKSLEFLFFLFFLMLEEEGRQHSKCWLLPLGRGWVVKATAMPSSWVIPI